MKKTANIKATKLMVDDHLEIGGSMYRISHLNRTFGRGRDRVCIGLHPIEGSDFHMTITVPKKARFTIFNQK